MMAQLGLAAPHPWSAVQLHRPMERVELLPLPVALGQGMEREAQFRPRAASAAQLVPVVLLL